MGLSAGSSVTVPYYQDDEKRHRRKIAEWSKQVNQGHIPVVGNVTLAALTAATVVADGRVGAQSYIGLEPTTAKGLSAAPTVYVSSFGDGKFTLAHSTSIATTKTFRYVVFGT